MQTDARDVISQQELTQAIEQAVENTVIRMDAKFERLMLRMDETFKQKVCSMEKETEQRVRRLM